MQIYYGGKEISQLNLTELLKGKENYNKKIFTDLCDRNFMVDEIYRRFKFGDVISDGKKVLVLDRPTSNPTRPFKWVEPEKDPDAPWTRRKIMYLSTEQLNEIKTLYD